MSVDWFARGLSVVAIAAAGASAWFTKRQAVAAEDANWLNTSLRFTASVDMPNSGAARVTVTFEEGSPLDQVELDLLNAPDGPLVGFGAAVADSTTWTIGAMEVGGRAQKPVVQRLRQEAGGGYQDGEVRLRVTCRGRGHQKQRQQAVTAEIPRAPSKGRVL